MSLLPRNFLINDAYLTKLGDPIKPAVCVEPPKEAKNDWTCATWQDKPPKATVFTPNAAYGALEPYDMVEDLGKLAKEIIAKRKTKIWTDIEAAEPANPKPVPKSARPFQAGNLVRILDGSKIPDYYGSWIPSSMGGLVGKTYIVKASYPRDNGRSSCYVFDDPHVFDARGLELVEAAK